MSAAELRKKTEEELDEELLALMREQFNLRMQKGTGQLSKPSEVKRVRRQIARVKTLIDEKAVSNQKTGTNNS